MSAIEGVVAYQRWSLRGVPLYIVHAHKCSVAHARHAAERYRARQAAGLVAVVQGQRDKLLQTTRSP